MKVFAGIRLAMILAISSGICVAGSAGKPEGIIIKDARGKEWHPLEAGDKSKVGTALIFYWHDCPVSKGYAPEINRLAAGHTNFAFFIVEVDPDISTKTALAHAKEYSLQPTVLLDREHRLVEWAGATVTPQAVLISNDRKIVYRGRIDDRHVAIGKARQVAAHHDFVEAMAALSAGKLGSGKLIETTAIGCIIEPARK